MSSFTNFEETKVPPKPQFRLGTFNVHMFLDYKKRRSMKQIIETIEILDCDLIILQEAMFYKKKIEEQFAKYLKKTKYKHYYNSTGYGINVFLSKKPLNIDEMKVINLGKGNVGKFNRYASSCYVTINNIKHQIIGTHLDVFDETGQSRCKQLKVILKHINKDNHPVIILGDFNALKRSDYSDQEWNVITEINKKRGIINTPVCLTNQIEKHGFVDSCELSQQTPPKITVWTNRRVDYIYLKVNEDYTNNMKLNTWVYKTFCSDHYPVVLDFD